MFINSSTTYGGYNQTLQVGTIGPDGTACAGWSIGPLYPSPGRRSVPSAVDHPPISFSAGIEYASGRGRRLRTTPLTSPLMGIVDQLSLLPDGVGRQVRQGPFGDTTLHVR